MTDLLGCFLVLGLMGGALAVLAATHDDGRLYLRDPRAWMEAGMLTLGLLGIMIGLGEGEAGMVLVGALFGLVGALLVVKR